MAQLKQASRSIAFTTAISFDTLHTDIATYTGSTPQTFTINSVNAKSGYGCALFYRANGGTNEPNLSAFTQLGTEAFDNTNGSENLLLFLRLGSQYFVRILPPAVPGGGDTTAPTVTGIVASDAHTIAVSFDSTVTGSTGFVFKQNGTPVTIASHSSASTVITYTITETLLSTDTLTADYAPGDIVNGSSVALAAITAHAVTNSIASADGTPETVDRLDGRWTFYSAGSPWADTGVYHWVGYYYPNAYAQIDFTKGFKLIYTGNPGHLPITAVIYIDDVLTDTVSVTTDGQTIYEHHPNTGTTKTVKIGFSAGDYLSLVSIILYS
jgi:hypothetical protein